MDLITWRHIWSSSSKFTVPVRGHPWCYLVYVGWESVKHHDDYHHTQHFANRQIILRLGNKGWTKYGHIDFSRRAGEGVGALVAS
ncbi:hypothetical protein F4780DRAFT_766107 [Xylariomycetidae sp. FL0641]|nr:hypothetical protein F4780DRAFT_766107 [Xylariomycetidae sp. FL0641]